MAGLNLVPDESVDVAITSPDYNLGIHYHTVQEVKQADEYLAWASAWGREIMRTLKPKGSFFLNVSGAPSRPLLSHFLAIRFSEFAVLQNTFHWIKAISIKGERDSAEKSWGHFKPITSDRFVNDQHEYVFHFTKRGNVKIDRKAIGVPYMDKSNITRWGHTKGEDVRCRGNTWFVPYTTIRNRKKDRPHPATFPAQLAYLAYKITRCGNQSVLLDPFVGIGNAGLAAKWIQAAKFIGIDREQYYIDEAEKLILKN